MVDRDKAICSRRGLWNYLITGLNKIICIITNKRMQTPAEMVAVVVIFRS